jgi:hypothetical protein
MLTVAKDMHTDNGNDQNNGIDNKNDKSNDLENDKDAENCYQSQ